MVVEVNQMTERYSYNQIKEQLTSYIFPSNSFTFMINHKKEVELSGDQLVDYILSNLPRKQILELLEMLKIIKNRNSETMNYLQYILHGINKNKEMVEQK